jgi:hypothetical protein
MIGTDLKSNKFQGVKFPVVVVLIKKSVTVAAHTAMAGRVQGVSMHEGDVNLLPTL